MANFYWSANKELKYSQVRPHHTLWRQASLAVCALAWETQGCCSAPSPQKKKIVSCPIVKLMDLSGQILLSDYTEQSQFDRFRYVLGEDVYAEEHNKHAEN